MQKYWVTVDDEGTTRWFKDAKCTVIHREGAPAIEYADGTKAWWLNGLRHRTDGPSIEFANGTKEWYQNDQLHRTDGPAMEYANGGKSWFLNGKLHRTDGPAIQWPGHPLGDKSWFLNGKHLTEQQHQAQTAPIQEMTVADIEAALGKRVKIIK